MHSRLSLIMDNLKYVMDYIRSFFAEPLEVPRKRRAPETFDSVISSKLRRIAPGMAKRPEDNWRNVDFRSRKPSKLLDTINLDEDDSDPVVHLLDRSKKFTSTPADHNRIRSNLFTNGGVVEDDTDDIQLVSELSSPALRKDKARKSGMGYMSTYTNDWLSLRKAQSSSMQRNGAIPKRPSTHLSPSSPTLLSRNRLSTSKDSARDYSFRLEDKQQYRRLLESHNSTGSVYQTPIGKLFNESATRRGRILALAQQSKGKSPSGSLPTVKDTIIKTLDDMETEAVVVPDSESDDDVVVCPPSPKPDIKVEPINSLKKVMDTSLHSKSDWLEEKLDRHRDLVASRQRTIAELRENCDKYSSINRDIQRLHITNKINDSLALKEAVLPVIEVQEEFEFPELTNEHLRMVKRAFSGDPNEILAKKFNLNITRRDLLTLSGLNWLNDEVINFYMNLIMERSKECSNQPKAYCFNTFFYPKIIKDGPSAVRRWTKRIDLFSYDVICAPIHLGMHWCMAVVNLREKWIRYYDSMGSSNGKCLEALRHYLEVEHKDKKGAALDTSDFVLENVKDIPQQMNGSDCGMFSCTFAEFLSRNCPITFSQEDMPYLRRKMVVEILTGELLIK